MTVTELPAPMAKLKDFRVGRPTAADGRTFPMISITLVDPQSGDQVVLNLALTDEDARKLAVELAQSANGM